MFFFFLFVLLFYIGFILAIHIFCALNFIIEIKSKISVEIKVNFDFNFTSINRTIYKNDVRQ